MKKRIPEMKETTVDAKTMTLMDLPVGGAARVISVNGGGRVAQRLMEMGVVPGVAVKVVRTAPFGDPIEVKVRGYSLAMRRSEAQTIDVSS